MNFKLKNFGKIAEADIKLDGITVICGDNNTGKSTVGKALFAFFNSLYDLKNKIDAQKNIKLRTAIRNYIVHSVDLPLNRYYSNSTMEYISEHGNHFYLEEVKEYLEQYYGVKLPEDQLDSLVDYLNTPAIDILNEYVYRYITNVMNGQIKNVNSVGNSDCYIAGEIKDFTNKINIKSDDCKCDLDEPLVHSAYYINSPFVLDWLNNPERLNILRAMNPMDRSTVSAIINAQSEINEDSMTNILDTVINRAELKIIEDVLKKAYRGTTKISNGKYFYTDENGKDFDFRNISAGLKSFALIERMLETGVLKKKDVLILDEPEIHLHSEWQIIYAELIVALQKHFDLNILIVTHSFQFLEALDFFMKTSEKPVKRNYYIPEQTDKGIVMKPYGNNPDELKQNLVKGSLNLANMEFKYEMEQDKNGTQED